MELLRSIEHSQFSEWVLSSGSLLAYPAILFLHTMGMATVVGLNAGMDLRILGVAPEMPVAPMERWFPLMSIGFWVNAVYGTALLLVDASAKLANPVFYIKMLFIALALIDLRLLRKRVFDNSAGGPAPIDGGARFLAASSLLLWMAAITAGRLLAYLGPVK